VRLHSRRFRLQIGTLLIEGTPGNSLDLAFEVERSLRPKPGKLTAKIFNLTADHRALAQAQRRSIVELSAGYRDGLAMIFRGDVLRVRHARDGDDWVTTVTGGDGHFAIRAARAARAFGPDTTLESVVRALADAMAVGVGNVREALAGARLDRLGDVFPRGTVVRGPAARELTELLNSAGLSWSIQDGVLQVVPRGGALQRTAIRLAPDTGLIGSPEKDKNGVVTATSLLNPELVPGRLVQLESDALRGVYSVRKVKWTGETAGTPWYAECDLRERRD
jgi:hypothetical protein